MPRKKKPEPDDKEQSERFKEAAAQIQCADAKEAFDEAMAKIAQKRKINDRQ
jgi:hypothetical protein